jgi:hypothetical protein
VLRITNDATAGIVAHTTTTTTTATTSILVFQVTPAVIVLLKAATTTLTTTTTTTTSLLQDLQECPTKTPFKPSCHRQKNENKNGRVVPTVTIKIEKVAIDDDQYIRTATPPSDPVVTTIMGHPDDSAFQKMIPIMDPLLAIKDQIIMIIDDDDEITITITTRGVPRR